LGKVFSSVLNNQLISHFESKGLISDWQKVSKRNVGQEIIFS
jgi:hypothetical protein